MSAALLSVDDYYHPLDRQPRYAARKLRSDVDYDHIESLDVDLATDHISALICGQSIMKPSYNMETGYRHSRGHRVSMPKNGILIIEGIHVLNPVFSVEIQRKEVLKVFLSLTTTFRFDDNNVIESSDCRLIRRLVRDHLFRGNSASHTLATWEKVRRAEGNWIYPFRGQADIAVDTAHEYEIALLKTCVEPLLKAVSVSDANYSKAEELLQVLDKVTGWDDRYVPPASLLREFIGNGLSE